MDAHLFGRSQGRIQPALRLVAVLLATAVLLVSGSGTGYAVGPPGGGAGQGGAVGPGDAAGLGPVSFFDQWLDRDTKMQLSQDGSGTLTMGDGARYTDQWSVTWRKNPSDSIIITLDTLIARSGNGPVAGSSSGLNKVGDRYMAKLEPEGGLQRLYLFPVDTGQARALCTPAQARSPKAPAVCRNLDV
jgi:hypothetical protein